MCSGYLPVSPSTAAVVVCGLTPRTFLMNFKYRVSRASYLVQTPHISDPYSIIGWTKVSKSFKLIGGGV